MTNKRLQLTASRLREVLEYDLESGIFRWRMSRGMRRAGATAGCVMSKGYVFIKIDSVIHTAHRLAVLYMTGQWPPHEVDHKDLNKANNAWSNLRLATSSQNKRNVIKARKSAAGFKGVNQTPTGRYRATMSKDRKCVYLGEFDTAIEAHAAYMAAAGEFAQPR